MDLNIKQLEMRVDALEEELKRGPNLEVETYYLIAKNELDYWECREET